MTSERDPKKNHSITHNRAPPSSRDSWGQRTRLVNDTREQLKQVLGKYPSQRSLCKKLNISPKILGKCIQKIEERSASKEKQGARKQSFDPKLFRGLSLIYFSGVHDGSLCGMAAANFVDTLLDLLMLVPEYHKIIRTRIPTIVVD